jgi:hypothetical protein
VAEANVNVGEEANFQLGELYLKGYLGVKM